VLSVKESIDTNVDWSSAGSCYKFFPTNLFQMEQKADGTWAGYRQVLPITKIDPSVMQCNFPRMALPPRVEILCSAVNK
jgi:hypothetical protein